jgi:hypothetical protein
MKIIIENTRFDYNIGCRLLKTKYGNVPFKGLEDIWEDIIPITFKEISKEIQNIEQRRIAVGCLGLEKIYKEVNPKLVSSKTILKETFWVGENGELIKKEFSDTYELYKVEGNNWGEGTDFGWRTPQDVHFVKCKDTSTDREYFIWVDAQSVYRTNKPNEWLSSSTDFGKVINPIQAIAWTIQTDIKEGGIEKIVRQGDCVLIKKKKNCEKGRVRHLTEKEYLKLLVAES